MMIRLSVMTPIKKTLAYQIKILIKDSVNAFRSVLLLSNALKTRFGMMAIANVIVKTKPRNAQETLNGMLMVANVFV